jgi:hypothetical protein
MKTCKKCNVEKALSEYYKSKKNLDGLDGTCKACRIIYSTQWQKDNPEKKKATWRKANYNRYGITHQDKLDMVKAQNSKCAICERELDTEFQACVDHCHTTKVIRGILCRNCNVGIGLFKDSLDILKSAQNYLKRYSKK